MNTTIEEVILDDLEGLEDNFAAAAWIGNVGCVNVGCTAAGWAGQKSPGNVPSGLVNLPEQAGHMSDTAVEQLVKNFIIRGRGPPMGGHGYP